MKKPTDKEENEWLAELAVTNLHLKRCRHCNWLTLYGYICQKCGEDSSLSKYS